jgi:hypothetical protein
MFIERAHVRREVSLEARIIVRGKVLRVIPCKILDLSEGGAKVQLDAPFLLPPEFFLLENASENLYECELRWQNETAGLMFIDICSRAKRKALIEEIEAAMALGRPRT